MKFKHGLVVGKFCPLHRGHQLVIDTALEQCEHVFIITYTSRDLGFDAMTRFDWIMKLYGDRNIDVLAIEDKGGSGVPDDNASDLEHRVFCAGLCEDERLQPDAVFTSESYGDGFARFLSDRWVKPVDHVCVDILRLQIPISGTALRDDKSLWQDFVDPRIQDES